MLIFALSLLLTSPQAATPLTFVHGDEQIVTWLDPATVRRAGNRVRVRVLRIRHPDQAFWVAEEIDCATNTWALIGETTDATGAGDTLPSLEGQAHHQRLSRDDRAGHATRDALCDGEFFEAALPSVPDVATAIARLAETKAAVVRARPLELIVVSAGAVLLDRATLEGGGPQWEVRSLKMTGGQGVWSGWVVDCDRSDLALDLQWTAPLVEGGYGTITRDREFGGEAAADAEQAALVDVACHPLVWDMPAHDAIERALRAAAANPG